MQPVKSLIMGSIINKIFKPFSKQNPTGLPTDFDELHQQIYNKVAPFTMTGPARVYSLIEAIKYIEQNNVKGDIVECGVWKGGSMMAVAETLKYCNNTARHLYLYDTYEGMSAPTENDKTFDGTAAKELLESNTSKEKNLVWAYSSLDSVKQVMQSTAYPSDKIHFVKGKVEDTIPQTIPSSIALLRLDTDWYESTRHELINLFPLLVAGGVLIIDDYGHWQGARKAVDEYFKINRIPIFLGRIDETGRIAIKQ